MNKTSYNELLRIQLSQFGTLEDAVLSEMSSFFKNKSFQKNTILTKEGEYAKYFGFLQSGIVRAFVRDEDGKEFNKQFFVGPSIIGAYTSLLTKTPSKIIHESLTACDMIVADFTEITSLYDKYHSVERLGRKVAEHYYIEKERKLIEQAVLDAEQRYLIFKKHFSHIENQIPQYHIASYVGVTPTQLSRIRGKLSQEATS